MASKKETKLITPGKWFAEFDEHGNAGETFYDKSFLDLLGYETQEEFSHDQNSWQNKLHPDDRERVNAYFEDLMLHHPEGKDYDVEYRIMTKWGYRWFHDYAKIRRRDNGSVIRFDGVTFDIQQVKDNETHQQHAKLKNELLDYIINHDDDPIELLKVFAEKIRALIDCDQVIYRDLEKVRIMVNSPSIEKTWAVPLSYCEQCQHLDPHHPMYAGGYTEMENCQEGWQGIPVYHKCPIKSSLTRIVYLDGKVAGYMAFHYVQKYHKFTDLERETLEEIVRNLSLVLSRYEKNKQLEALKKNDERQRQYLIHQMAGDDGVFIVDCAKDTFRVIHDRQDGLIDYQKEERYSSTIANYIKKYTADIDQENMLKCSTPEYMQKRMKDENTFSVIFRDTITGTSRYSEMKVVKLSDTEVLQSFSDCDEKIKMKIVNDKVIADFASVFLLDLDHDYYHFLSRNSDSGFKDVPGGVYSETIQEYISRVNPDYRKTWLNAKDMEGVRRLLRKQDRWEYSYPLEGISKRWRRCTIQLLDSQNGEPVSAIMTYFTIDDAAAKTLELSEQIARQQAELEKALSIANEEALRSDTLHDIIHSGKWSFFVNADDEITRAVYSDEVQRIINNDIPATGYAWSEIVHPNDKEAAIAAFNAAIADHSCKTPYDVVYRMIDRNGQYHWFHSAGRVVRDKDGNGEFFGVHIDVTQNVEKQLSDIRRTMNMMFSLSDQFDPILVLDPESGEYDWFMSMAEDVVTNTSMASHGDNLYKNIGIDAAGIIHPDDRAQYQAFYTKENMMKVAETGISQEIENRWFIQTEGMYKWKYNKAVRMIDENGKAFVIIGVMDTTESKSKARELAQKTAISNFFLSSFSTAYYCNLKDDTFTVLQSSQLTDEILKGKDLTFKALVDLYIDNYIHPDDREICRTNLQPEFILNQLAHSEDFSFTYRDISSSQPGIFRCTIIRGEDENYIGIGFQNITEEIAHQQELQKSDQLITVFANQFEGVFVENFKTGTFKTINDSRKLLEGREIPNFRTFLEEYTSAHVHPYDLHHFQKTLFDDNAVIYTMKIGEERSFEYRSGINGEYEWRVFSFIRINEDEVLYGFADRDEEIVNRIVRDKLLDEYDALYVLDLDMNEIRPSRASRVTDVGVFRQKINYKEVALRFADTVDPQYKEDWIRFSDVNYMKQYMAEEDHREYVYVLPGLKNSLRRFTVDVLDRIDGEAKTVLLSFMGIDDLHAERILLNAKLAEQTVQLEDALELAKSASNAKTSFLFNMSHDIRTPINAITGFTLMAKKYVDDKERVTDYLEKIDVSGQQLLMLINQVLEMARIESGKVEFDENPVNIKERFEIMITVLAEQAELRGLDFHHSLTDLTHYHVFADDTRMSQITLNIVGNALKYTHEGGRVDFLLKEIPARREGYATYVFTVEDTGIGMSQEFLENLFEPFAREKSSTVSHIQGTGLGLSIVKSLVDLAGGKIEVKSELGKGTRFDITLDFKIDEKFEAQHPEMVSEEIQSGEQDVDYIHLKGKRVLLVEDNELNREIAKFLLEDMGLVVTEATDGKYAVEEMQAVIKRGEPDYYDAILMDIQMPIMDGYAATRAIREMEKSPHHIPIIAVSANAFAEDRQKSHDAGMDSHIAKPIDTNELVTALSRFMK